MAEPNPTEVAPWYLRNITQALALDEASGNVYVRTDANISIGTANVTVGNVGITSIGNIPISGNTLPISGNVSVTGNVTIVSLPEVEIKNDIDNPIPISKDTNVNSQTNPIYVEGVNNASFFAPTQSDSFGRLRVSNPQTLFDTQARYYNHNQFASSTAGAGTYTYNSNSSTFAMAVNTASGDKVYAETYKVFPYQPGKSLLIYSSFCMNIAKPNLRQRVGYFSSQNGVYFEQSDSTLYMVIRSYSSGSVVENRVAQSSWNGDPLNGLGPSGIELNPAVDQIFFCDIEWLGVGSVRTGFIIGGQYIVVHTFEHANIPGNTTTYMSTGSLPLRFEIENTSTASSSSTLRQICSTVISEGGYSLSGTPRSIGHDLGTPVRLPNDTSFKPLLSIRLLSTCPDSIVLPTFFTIAPVAQSTFKYRIYSRAVTTCGTWTGIGASSPVEYNLAPTAVSSGEIVTEGFIMSSNQTAAAPSQEQFGFEVQLQRQPFTNVMYEYVMTAATTGTNQDVYASIEWQEVS